ncbi:hypothetical protein, partial [Escherichia coli]|uniref:hypothetical protein n=1 Tax=Escherichia coli TaxID=562 RepID=UPI0031F70A73
PKTSIICSPMTSLKTSIKTITYLSDTGCLEIQGASLCIYHNVALRAPLKRTERDSDADTAKRDVLPSENRKNASGSFSAHCIAMHENE